MKVYVVYSIWQGEEENVKIYDVDMIFSTEEKAQQYVDDRISPELYEIEEWEVE